MTRFRFRLLNFLRRKAVIYKKIVLIAALITASNFAVADSTDSSNKFYVGAAGGYSDLNGYKDTRFTWTAYDETSMSWKFFGGYQVNEMISVEGSYNNLGKLTGTANVGSGETTSTAWVAAIKISPLSSSLISPFAKIGASYLSGKQTAAGETRKDNSTGVYYGVGVEYAISSQISAALEYENFGKVGDASNTNTGFYQIKPVSYSVALRYKF
jgi:opacity protein-like surface antigen